MDELLFIPNQIYNRRGDIHLKYGGNVQSGICPSARYPYIFIFTGKSGTQHGYQDVWENENVFSYTGEGQNGDMEFTRGNLALRDHLKTGKRVFLFEHVKKGFVKFISELTFLDCDFYETHDTGGKSRIGIKFFFKRVGATIQYELNTIPLVAEDPEEYLQPTLTERSGVVLSRVGQGAYRKSIINRWENQCAVTGFNDSRVLIASHIHPWKDANDNERLDINNGILLSPTYDALFDRHLITFENNGKIVLTDSIKIQTFNKVGVTGNERIRNLRDSNFIYLEKHQTQFEALNK